MTRTTGNFTRSALLQIRSLLIFIVSAATLSGSAASAYEGGVSAENLLKTSHTIVGEDILYPHSGKAVVEVVIVTILPGEKTSLHRHGVPLIGYILEGELSVFYEGIGLKKFPQGSSYVETMNVNHFGENATDSVVKVLVVYAGADGSQTVLPASK